MKRLLPLLLLLLPACKESGWTFLQRTGGESVPGPVEPGPVEPQDTRDIIFVLGIDGMD
jgi:hypothetical protein